MYRWSRGGVRPLTLSGVVIAGVGFILTRFTVTFAASESLPSFLLVGLTPLVLGLSVAVVGVALAVGEFHPTYVRTVAGWTLAGTLGLGLLVALTVYGRTPEAGMTMATVRNEPYLSNVLIGGCVGGTLIGVYAARNERRRLVQRAQAKRLAVLNHLFRDATLNAITAIRGRLEVARGDDRAAADEALTDIDERAAALATDVEELRHLTRGSDEVATHLEPIDVVESVQSAVADVRERYPAAEIELTGTPDEQYVWASSTVEDAVSMLLESAVDRSEGGDTTVAVRVERVGGRVRVHVTDRGPPLPAERRRHLAAATEAPVVDPTTEFELQVAELLVESYRGELTADVTDEGTTVTADLAVADTRSASTSAATTSGVTVDRLALVVGASLVAGFVMGVATDALAGAVPVIGTLYGVADPVVGWVTHQFHSLVFGLIYAGILTTAPRRLDAGHRGRIAGAVAWSALLWLVAAGVIMPIWLRLVGVPAMVPNLVGWSLFAHLLWGGVLGTVYSVGRERREARRAAEGTDASAVPT